MTNQVRIRADEAMGFGYFLDTRESEGGCWIPVSYAFTRWGAHRKARRLLAAKVYTKVLTKGE